MILFFDVYYTAFDQDSAQKAEGTGGGNISTL